MLSPGRVMRMLANSTTDQGCFGGLSLGSGAWRDSGLTPLRLSADGDTL